MSQLNLYYAACSTLMALTIKLLKLFNKTLLISSTTISLHECRVGRIFRRNLYAFMPSPTQCSAMWTTRAIKTAVHFKFIILNMPVISVWVLRRNIKMYRQFLLPGLWPIKLYTPLQGIFTGIIGGQQNKIISRSKQANLSSEILVIVIQW